MKPIILAALAVLALWLIDLPNNHRPADYFESLKRP